MPPLRHPLHGEFLAHLGAVEKIKIDQLLVRKAGVVGQGFEIVHNLRTQANRRGCRAEAPALQKLTDGTFFLAGVRLVPLLPQWHSFGVK